MEIRHYTQKIKKIHLPLLIFRFLNRNKEQFECPICNYKGPFMDLNSSIAVRKHAKCPKCGAVERHRIQYLVIMNLLKNLNISNMKMIHFAPEALFRPIFSRQFEKYETADLNMDNVDHNVDVQNLPFDDASYDFVFASHVLEHIPDDNKAINEIRRVLKPNGIAILPVPLVCDRTVEYPTPNPNEDNHIRAPGMDYIQRYEQYFSKVEQKTSNSFPDKYQLFIYENRSMWPTKKCPLRPPMQGEKHIDVVPICYV